MKGEGATITDLAGRTVLDAIGGPWNVNLAIVATRSSAYDAGVMIRISRNNIIL